MTQGGPFLVATPWSHHAGKRQLVSWTDRERLRFLWYRLRPTVREMSYASRRMIELQMRLP
jgi:hypothetical protein